MVEKNKEYVVQVISQGYECGYLIILKVTSINILFISYTLLGDIGENQL